MFKNAVVDAYEVGSVVSSYGLNLKKSSGAATLNLHPLSSPVTVSPITKGVEFVLLSTVGSLIISNAILIFSKC